MYFHNDDRQNYPFLCKLQILVEKLEHFSFVPTNQDLIKSNESFQKKENVNKTLGSSII